MKRVVTYLIEPRIPKRGPKAGKPQPGMAWVVSLQHGFMGNSRFLVQARKAAQRRACFAALVAAFGPGPLPAMIDGKPNVFVVTMVRNSAGSLDRMEVSSVFKYVVDATAFWVQHGIGATYVEGWRKKLGHGDELLDWKYEQAPNKRGIHSITIRIEDAEVGPDIVVGAAQVAMAPPLPMASPVAPQGPAGPKALRKGKAAGAPAKAYGVWGGELRELTNVAAFDPSAVTMTLKSGGVSLTLVRRLGTPQDQAKWIGKGYAVALVGVPLYEENR